MNKMLYASRLPRLLIAATLLLGFGEVLVNGTRGLAVAAAAGPAAGDGSCSIDITVQSTPTFSERLSCRYSNFPNFESDFLSWETPRGSGGRTVNLSTGKPTADFARISLHDDRLPSTASDGGMVMFPVAGHLYMLDSSSKEGWSGIVDVFPDPKDLSPVECKGGEQGNSPSSNTYIADTWFKAKWDSLTQDVHVAHGSAEALLNCTKINLRGPNVPLGVVGRIVVNF